MHPQSSQSAAWLHLTVMNPVFCVQAVPLWYHVHSTCHGSLASEPAVIIRLGLQDRNRIILQTTKTQDQRELIVDQYRVKCLLLLTPLLGPEHSKFRTN